jgi:hypothetical protein
VVSRAQVPAILVIVSIVHCERSAGHTLYDFGIEATVRHKWNGSRGTLRAPFPNNIGSLTLSHSEPAGSPFGTREGVGPAFGGRQKIGIG